MAGASAVSPSGGFIRLSDWYCVENEHEMLPKTMLQERAGGYKIEHPRLDLELMARIEWTSNGTGGHTFDIIALGRLGLV
jgi:hypothetical protein